jgi:hypothetical protein
MSTIAAAVLVELAGAEGDVTAALDRGLGPLSRLHLAERLIIAPYAVSAEHEFQTVLTAPAHLPRVMWELRMAFHPMQPRVAVGLGELRSLPRRSGEPIHEAGSGEAFDNARRAGERLRSRSGTKYPLLTVVCGVDPVLDAVLNGISRLHDTLLLQITPRQWQAVLALEREGRQDLAAAELGIDESTISRTLQRAHHWQLHDARKALTEILGRWQTTADGPVGEHPDAESPLRPGDAGRTPT